jgi:hypothetical protein
MNRESSSLSPPTLVIELMGSHTLVIRSLVCGSSSVVEHLLAKEKVAGSIPVSRSRFT